MDDKEKNVPLPVGMVFPEAAEELTNGKGEDDDENKDD